MDELKYSVLMSVYYKEHPEYLRDSIISMLQQESMPDEIVIIKDGPLNDNLNRTLDEFKNNKLIKIISLEKNVGLGKALSIGINHCKNELIARMDTDDISLNNRCAKQLDLFKKNNELSVVGTAVTEFIDDPNNIVAYKKVKTAHDEIKKLMKYRNPMNHPSVMFKKQDVLKVGNYQHWLLNEDYYLWIRMINHGLKFQNIDEPLVKMRITNETYLRRGGRKYFHTQKGLFEYMLKNNYINIYDYFFNNAIRFLIHILLSNTMRRLLYLNILRKRNLL